MKEIIATSVIVLVTLSGCLSESSSNPNQLERFSAPITFDCSNSQYTPADICAHTLGQNGDSWAEPYVIAHPSERGTFIVAVQGQPASDLDGEGPLPSLSGFGALPCNTWGTCIFITEDFGTTWRMSDVGDGDLLADPIMTFAGNRLVVGALSFGGETTDVAGSSIKVYGTDDLGVTWDRAIVVSQAGTDRPWMTAHGTDILMVWQTSGQVEGWWSISGDAGKTWSSVQTIDCNLWGRPVWLDGWHAACSNSNGTPIFEIDLDSISQVTVLGYGSGTRHASQTEGGAWIGIPGPARTAKIDDRANMGEAYSLRPADVNWGQDFIYWMEATPWGGLLAIVTGGVSSCILCEEGRELPVHLIQLDTNGTLVDSWVLSAGGTSSSDRVVQPAEQKVTGEFNGIACQQDTCLVAWMQDGLVDVAWVKQPAA